MKKFIVLTVSLLTAAVAAAGGTAAAADEQPTVSAQTEYPASFRQELTFTALTDFAVGDETYAFAEGGQIKVLENDALAVYSADSEVTALDYADGSFYYMDKNGAVAVLPDGTAAEHSFAFPTEISAGDFYYYAAEGELRVLNKTDDSVTPLTEYRGVKEYGGRVYAIRDNNLCVMDGAQSAAVVLSYTDYAAASEIAVGNTAAALKNSGAIYEIGFAALKSVTDNGQPVHITEVDLSDLSGETFRVGTTRRVGDEGAPAAGARALLLCETGNAVLISIAEKTYLLAATGVDIEYVSPLTPSYNRATVSVDDSCYAYYSPFINEYTQSFALATGKDVTVVAMADSQTEPSLAYNFYVISYTDEEGKTVTGYVPEGYLSEFTFVEKPPEITLDPDYSEDDVVKTVVLILVVVVLVLIAVGYLVYVGTYKQKENKKPPENN